MNRLVINENNPFRAKDHSNNLFMFCCSWRTVRVRKINNQRLILDKVRGQHEEDQQ
nr:hypothetical protein [Solemya velum gill symbiont]